MSGALFLLSQLGLALPGLPAAFHPAARRLPWPARCAVAWLAGSLAVTLAAVLASLLRIPWTVASLGLGGLAFAAAALGLARGRGWRRRGRGASGPPSDLDGAAAPEEAPASLRLLAAATLALAFAHLAAAALLARGTSLDLFFFWGVKAVRWAIAGGIDPEWLSSPFTRHLHITYPPLYPVTLVWGTLWAGELPWRLAPVTTLLWMAAAATVVASALGGRLAPGGATAVTALWAAALAASLVASFSLGSAEPPLLAYLSAAGALLLAERGPGGRWTAGLALAGAALTKQEAWATIGLLALGVALRDRSAGRPRPLRGLAPLLLLPAAASGLWMLYELSAGLPLSDPIRERALDLRFDRLGHRLGEILPAMARHLGAGSLGLAWLLPLSLALAARRRRGGPVLPELLPGLVPAVGLVLASFVYYLHGTADPTSLVAWTLPRLIQPGLALWVLAAGVAFARRA